MKQPRFKTVSRYWRIRADATMEEQAFGSYAECVAWASKVKHTFGDREMIFTVVQVTEREYHIAKPRRDGR